MDDPRARSVLEYWFGDLDQTPQYFAQRNRLWFGGGDAVDSYIREHFGPDLDTAVAGGFASWRATPRGSLALVVLLDQFSLNLYREEPQSYLQSELALPITRSLLDERLDWVLTPAERVFLYLPLEHSEQLVDQERSVEVFKALARDAPASLRKVMDGYLDYAVRHWRVVERFGRFPDRNEVFGRPSTPEELAFLDSDEAPF